jgi:hypothetical protein
MLVEMVRPSLAAFVALPAFVVLAACSSSSTSTEPQPPCITDTTEPNERPSNATALGEIHDDDEINLGQGTNTDNSPKKIRKAFSLHDGVDVDWHTVDVRDTGAGGNPRLSVIVGDGVEATAFVSCANGATKSVVCGLGTKVTDDPELRSLGCNTAKSGSALPQLTMNCECDGTSSDNARLHIRVKRATPGASCLRYELTVIAE